MNDDRDDAEVTHLRAECSTCQRVEIRDPGSQEYDRLENEFADHIDDGSPCHGYSIWAVYEDGGEERVI